MTTVDEWVVFEKEALLEAGVSLEGRGFEDACAYLLDELATALEDRVKKENRSYLLQILKLIAENEFKEAVAYYNKFNGHWYYEERTVRISTKKLVVSSCETATKAKDLLDFFSTD